MNPLLCIFDQNNLRRALRSSRRPRYPLYSIKLSFAYDYSYFVGQKRIHFNENTCIKASSRLRIPFPKDILSDAAFVGPL